MLETIGRILVPVDFSAPSDIALRAARALAKRYDASLILLHVTPLDVGEGDAVPSQAERAFALRELSSRAEAHNGDAAMCETDVISGDARSEIVRYADVIKPDVIVIATHGQTSLSSVFLGNVAEHVVRLAACPVIVIPRVATSPW
jgi:nucleotide-binding universal stress UspA family protein